MYFSNGNYEASARPRRPAGLENKSAWFVGSGLAAVAGAAFLIRDGQMPGKQITILEQQQSPGGALEGITDLEKGFVIRGGPSSRRQGDRCAGSRVRAQPAGEGTRQDPDRRTAAVVQAGRRRLTGLLRCQARDFQWEG